MFDDKFKEMEQKQKMFVKIYAVLCLVVLISLTAYIAIFGGKYMVLRDAVASNKELISVLRKDVVTEKASYETKKESFNFVFEEIETKLLSILPYADDYTNLTRDFDRIEADLNQIGNPFEVSSLSYQSPVLQEKYAILPVSLNIRSSEENFTKFLHMIEASGALNDDVRLMDIASIRLSFQEDSSEEQTIKIINFSVLINAYFQKT